jgi:hypothetical protein
MIQFFFLNSYKFKYYLIKIIFLLYLVLRYVCLFYLLLCPWLFEETILEEEPNNLVEPIDDVENLSEDEDKSHRSSWSYMYACVVSAWIW